MEEQATAALVRIARRLDRSNLSFGSILIAVIIGVLVGNLLTDGARYLALRAWTEYQLRQLAAEMQRIDAETQTRAAANAQLQQQQAQERARQAQDQAKEDRRIQDAIAAAQRTCGFWQEEARKKPADAQARIMRQSACSKVNELQNLR